MAKTVGSNYKYTEVEDKVMGREVLSICGRKGDTGPWQCAQGGSRALPHCDARGFDVPGAELLGSDDLAAFVAALQVQDSVEELDVEYPDNPWDWPEALSLPDFEQWRLAIHDELRSTVDLDVYELIPGATVPSDRTKGLAVHDECYGEQSHPKKSALLSTHVRHRDKLLS
ncbi:hypothetical protein K488DRAFT_75082 [Vararia minispora EC-137]|uniref:Uncharacterized protein n=1 Tax=Vararia minispora EC-137 TaxID=1314806 RepID=A0ACB8Q532_9AGAM|nr:hypothetical protein K488DRAFT_75082 [Vararia minispora EC-137]